VSHEATFVHVIMDLLQGMLLAAAGPLWQQMQQQTTAAEKCVCVCVWCARRGCVVRCRRVVLQSSMLRALPVSP
jgi:hypothetical protein